MARTLDFIMNALKHHWGILSTIMMSSDLLVLGTRISDTLHVSFKEM
jgi:hypothetical protein